MAAHKASVAAEAQRFTDIPNIGPAMAEDFRLLGLSQPADLSGKNPYALYEELCQHTGSRQDPPPQAGGAPSAVDTFIAAVRFMDGEPPLPWWHFTAERKQTLTQK